LLRIAAVFGLVEVGPRGAQKPGFFQNLGEDGKFSQKPGFLDFGAIARGESETGFLPKSR